MQDEDGAECILEVNSANRNNGLGVAHTPRM